MEFALLAISSLFAIIDPFGAIPAFLAMTPDNSPKERIRMARLASSVTAGILIVFALAGPQLFAIFGITFPAIQIAASIILLLVALDMLKAQRSRVHETTEETIAAREKDDIAITPLAIPMLAGPGAISTVLLLRSHVQSLTELLILLFSILVVCLATYLILRIAAWGARWLTPIGLKIVSRVIGLLLASLAVQFMLNALAELKKVLA